MRKTIYKTLVKTYVTCEERIALDRVITSLETYRVEKECWGYCFIVGGVLFIKKDIEDLRALVDFVRSDEHAPIVTFGFSAPDDVNVEYTGEE